MVRKTEIGRDDIWPMDSYAARRKELRRDLVEQKRHRRLEVGPDCTFYFENYATMWAQVHEMLYIERGGEEQIADELAAYNPLVPKGQELCAAHSIIDFEQHRRAELWPLRHQRIVGGKLVRDQLVRTAVRAEHPMSVVL